ncbi:MAG: protein-disulfide reductase DsbD family protein [Pseudoxanthomonas sp.]
MKRLLVSAMLFSAGALAAPGFALAQDSGDAELRWTVRAVPVPGEEDAVDVVLDADIAPGWVVYASDFEPPQIGPRPARLKLDEAPGYRADGKLQSPQARKGAGGNAVGEYAYTYFTGKAQFRQRVRRKAGAAQVNGTLSGQSCYEQTGLCTLFRERFAVAL